MSLHLLSYFLFSGSTRMSYHKAIYTVWETFFIKNATYCFVWSRSYQCLVFSWEIWKGLEWALEKANPLSSAVWPEMSLCEKLQLQWQHGRITKSFIFWVLPLLLTWMAHLTESFKRGIVKAFPEALSWPSTFCGSAKNPTLHFEHTYNFWLASVFGKPSIKHQWNPGSQCSPESLDGCVRDKQPKTLCIIKLLSRFNAQPNSPNSQIPLAAASSITCQEKYIVRKLLESECLVPTVRTPASSSGAASQIFLPRVTKDSKGVALPPWAQIREHDDSLQCTAHQGTIFQQHIKYVGNFICWFCGVLSLSFPVHTGICGSR